MPDGYNKREFEAYLCTSVHNYTSGVYFYRKAYYRVGMDMLVVLIAAASLTFLSGVRTSEAAVLGDSNGGATTNPVATDEVELKAATFSVRRPGTPNIYTHYCTHVYESCYSVVFCVFRLYRISPQVAVYSDPQLRLPQWKVSHLRYFAVPDCEPCFTCLKTNY